MRFQLRHSLKVVLALMILATAAFILAPPTHAKGATRNAGARAPVGPNNRVIHPGFGAGAAVGNLGWFEYYWYYDGTAVTPYGIIHYTPYGYGWTLPAYVDPNPAPFPFGW